MVVKAVDTRDLIVSKGPKYPNTLMTTGSREAVRFTSMTDGDTTVVQITLYNEILATGVAKRHPQDARNQELGMALALTRAFTQAATRYAETVEHIMHPPADPSAQAVRELRKKFKADTVRRKNLRRETAREAHRRAHGWDHMNYPEHKMAEAEWERALRESADRRSH